MNAPSPLVRVVIACQCIAIAGSLMIHSVSAQMAQAPLAAASPHAGEPAVTLTGMSGEKASVTAAEIAALPRKTITVFNAHIKAQETYSGVLLSDELARVNAPFGDKLHGKALSIYVVAEGSDHYTAVYSLAEIDPAFHTGSVIIADTVDGKPLPVTQGPLQLVNTEDKHPARWVRQLVAVRLVAVQ